MSSTPRVSFNANKKGSEWYAGPKKNFINQFERSVQSTKLLSFQFCGKSDLVFLQIQFILQLWLQSNLCISVFLSVSTICNYPPICQSILLIVVSLHMSYCISLFFFGLSIIIVLSILCLFIYLSTFLPKVFYFFITSTKKFPNTTDGSAKDFSKRALPGLLSFFVFTVDSKFHLPVSGFEPVISCIRSDRSTNCTTNTALEVLQLVHYTFAIITVHSDWTQTTADSVVDCVSRQRKKIFHFSASVHQMPQRQMQQPVPQFTTPENTHHLGKDHCMAGLQFNKTRFDQKRKYVAICMECSS